MGSLLTNRNYIEEEIKCRLKAGNSCYYSVQSLCLLDFFLRTWNILYETIILPVVLYGCETWHVARMEEGRSAFKIPTGKPTGKRPLGKA